MAKTSQRILAEMPSGLIFRRGCSLGTNSTQWKQIMLYVCELPSLLSQIGSNWKKLLFIFANILMRFSCQETEIANFKLFSTITALPFNSIQSSPFNDRSLNLQTGSKLPNYLSHYFICSNPMKMEKISSKYIVLMSANRMSKQLEN